MGKIIEIQDLTFSHGEYEIFHKLSLSIDENTIYTVLGKTGSGKSTLARILVGLEETHDYIKICDLYLNPKNLKSIQDMTAILFENSEVTFVTNTVLEEISFPLQELGYSKKEIDKEVKLISKDFLVEPLLFRNVHGLSAGEKQLVALAAHLIAKPKLLVLDEALSMLDKCTKMRIWEMLKQYQQKNKMTILHFTDDSEDIVEGTDVLILSDGKVILQGDINTALQSEKQFIANQLELPFIADLSNKLRYYNTIPSIETDLEKLVDAIWK